MKQIIVTVLVVFYVITANAQDSTAQVMPTVQDTAIAPMDTVMKQEAQPGGKNLIKLNLSALVIGNYMLQYERVIKKNQSLALSVGYSSNQDLPFKSTLKDQFDENDDARSAIETTTFDKIMITPEYRFYLGKKGAPSGFYIAPFARYSHMDTEGDYDFHTQSDDNFNETNPGFDKHHTAHLKGKFDGWGGGVMFGSQWLFGKKNNLSLDLWIVGFGYGSLNGEFHGTGSMDDMSPEEKADLEKEIEDTDIPGWDIQATVGNDVIDATTEGPFYAIRGLTVCFGIRF